MGEYDEDGNLDRGQDPWTRRKARLGGQLMPAQKNSGVSLHGNLPTLKKILKCCTVVLESIELVFLYQIAL